MLNGLDLFSGIGGMSIAMEEWVRPVAYCENDRYCQGVLCSRMSDGTLTHAPIWDDVRTLDASAFVTTLEIDIIYGGFPCQDISVAGAGEGLEGERSGLFWELYRLVKEIKPSFVFIENVPAIRTRGMEILIKEFANIGYDCRWTRISAAEVGAPHIRQRWFLLAHSKRRKSGLESGRSSRESRQKEADMVDNLWKNAIPPDNRICDGLPEELDRIKALGNAVVPCQAKEAFQRLIGK